jgi:hypothetical protein
MSSQMPLTPPPGWLWRDDLGQWVSPSGLFGLNPQGSLWPSGLTVSPPKPPNKIIWQDPPQPAAPPSPGPRKAIIDDPSCWHYDDPPPPKEEPPKGPLTPPPTSFFSACRRFVAVRKAPDRWAIYALHRAGHVQVGECHTPEEAQERVAWFSRNDKAIEAALRAMDAVRKPG